MAVVSRLASRIWLLRVAAAAICFFNSLYGM
jgi:hypothetical protein